MVLTRLRMDELVNAWVADGDTPFQIGLLATFEAGPFALPDGRVDLARVADELVARALEVPELGRRVVWTRPGEGRPVWAVDPALDLTRHVVPAPAPVPGDLMTWAANRAVVPLDRDRPLWRADLVDGLAGGRFGVLLVVHHVLLDGLAGMRVLTSLLDGDPHTVRRPGGLQAAARLPTHRDLVLDRLRSLRPDRRRRVTRADRRRPSARRAVAQYRQAMSDLGPLPPTPWPRHVGRTRRMTVASAGLDPLREAAHRSGATVNDLVLAAVTGGLRHLLAARGACDDGLFLRTIVPVATDSSGQAAGMMVVDLPVGEPDAQVRLATIVARTTARKERLRAMRGTGNGILDLPAPVARLVVPRARRRGSERIHLSVTNVPGPPGRLWFAGCPMVEAVPVAPLVPLVPLTVGVLSYDGRVVVAANADGTMSDLDVLGEGLATTLAVMTS